MDRLIGKFFFSGFFRDELQSCERVFNGLFHSTDFYQQKICQYDSLAFSL